MEREDILAILQGISSIGSNVANYKIAQEKIQQTQNLTELTNLNTKLATDNANNLTLRKDFLKNSREDNEAKITSLITDIRRYNINAIDWSTLDDKFQTKDGQELLDSLGVEYGENFDFRERFAGNVNSQLDNTQNLVNLQRTIIDDLEKKRNQIFALQDDYMKVGTEAGISTIKDTKDILAYMQSDENKARFYDEEGNMKPLAHAFMTKKKNVGGVDYGFAPDYKQADLKAMGINYKTGQPFIQEKSHDLRVKAGLLSQSIETARIRDNDLGTTEGMLSGKYSEFLNKIDVAQIENILSGKNIYSKENQAAVDGHMQVIGDAILGMYGESIAKGDEGGVFSGIKRSADKQEELRKIGGFDIDPDSGLPYNNDISLKRGGVSRVTGKQVPGFIDDVIDRYTGDNPPTPIIDPDNPTKVIGFTPATERTKIPRGKQGQGAYGLLNYEAHEDRIIFGQGVEGLDTGPIFGLSEEYDKMHFGTDDHSLVWYRLMDMYKGLKNLKTEF